MKWSVILFALSKLIKHIDSEDVKELIASIWDKVEPEIDRQLDKIEIKHAGNPMIIALCNLLRGVASIEDNDDVPEV